MWYRRRIAWISGAMAGAALSIFISPFFEPFQHLGAPFSYPGCALIDGLHSGRHGNPETLITAYQNTDRQADAVEYDLQLNRSWISDHERNLQEEPMRFEESIEDYNERAEFCSSLSLPMTMEEYERLETRRLEVGTERREIVYGRYPQEWTVDERNQRYLELDELLTELTSQSIAFDSVRRAIQDCESDPPEPPLPSRLERRLAFLESDLNERREMASTLETEFEELAEARNGLFRDLEARRKLRETLPEVCKQYFKSF